MCLFGLWCCCSLPCSLMCFFIVYIFGGDIEIKDWASWWRGAKALQLRVNKPLMMSWCFSFGRGHSQSRPNAQGNYAPKIAYCIPFIIITCSRVDILYSSKNVSRVFYKKLIKMKIIKVFCRGAAKSYFSVVLAVGLVFCYWWSDRKRFYHRITFFISGLRSTTITSSWISCVPCCCIPTG